MTTPAESPAAQPAPETADLSRRYGRRQGPGRSVMIGGLAVLAVLVLGFVYWATVLNQNKVTWQDNSFDVRSASEIVVTFDVQLHRGATRAVCTVHALNTLNTEVGLVDVAVDGRGTDRLRMKVTVPTSEEATTGVVQACVAK